MVLAWLNQTDQKVLRFNGIVTYSIKAFAVYVSMVFSELVFSWHAPVIFSYQLCGGVVKIFVRNWSKEPESYENGEKFAAFSGIFAFSTFPPAAPEPTIVPGKTCRGASEKSTHMGLTVTKDIKTYKGTKSDHSVKYFRHHYRHHSLHGFL